ncbi:hypothetical protein WME99_04990 [Sorangium sp. So ce136]|uniref:hypothetical protein n=1 Tax=Sorangium sp. So ce136 TaxID=3133284 RepID=UPI003EFF3104
MRKRAAIAPRKQPTQDRSRATVEAILQATAYILVRDGYVAAHAVQPELHRVFSEQMPRIKELRSAASEGFLLEEARQLLSGWGCAPPDVELAWWMMQTVAHAVVHQAIVERPGDLRSGALAAELVLLLERYLLAKKEAGAGAGREIM